jgi:glycosyltransferase involved in cell wall biosynthesis
VLVLTSVRFAPEKNVDLILRIAPAVIAVCPQTVFVLAGDGPLLEELKQEVVSKKLEDNVKFIGFQSDVRGLLAMSDIFLLPSFLELHSIALLEAMSMAKPVVISRDVGCHSEFIQDGANGLLLDPFCDAGWAEAINRLVANPDQPCRLGVAALETCRTLFDIRDVVKRLEYIYSDLAIGDIQEIRIV